MKSVEKACIPPELEKTSTDKPNIKEVIRTGNLFFLNGNKKTKAIYRYGFMKP